jgi:hypothetical protein
MKLLLTFITVSFLASQAAAQQKNPFSLSNGQIYIDWALDKNRDWKLQKVQVKKGNRWIEAAVPSGEFTLLYSSSKPSSEPSESFEKITGGKFPEDVYHYQQTQWKESITEVPLNTSGTAYHFFPSSMQKKKNEIVLKKDTEVATVTSTWNIDPAYPSDVQVTMTLKAKRKGFFSMASPTLATLLPEKIAWVSVPGYFQGNAIQKNFALAYAYGHGIPDRPVIYRERCATTLSPLMSSREGITLSVIPEPGQARDPWKNDKSTQIDWYLGLSHMNRKGQLSPTLYYPVLGEDKSAMNAGDEITFTFRYSLIDGDWFQAIRHAADDIYKFGNVLALRQSKQGLSDRIEKMHHYLTDPKTSLWNIEEYKGTQIGAQSYLGGVVGSQKDAMKNADYGAMWMLATATRDPALIQKVLPPAMNFKLVQQNTDPGFFNGATEGQYYLAKSKKFVEEWGEVVEPIALTYYVMLDMGNMLLFDPENAELRNRLKLGAERLMSWQHAKGNFAVAYDRKTTQEIFKDLTDNRPTFYGLLVAYRILKDEKYLHAARKGADWLIKNAVETGSFLGVCGDARYAPDFATGQSAQAFLDLYDLTQDNKYKEAAIQCAKIYTTSVYTHPIANHSIKTVNGTQKEDWEINQAGLSFEHGGIFGSATRLGPIQLASHAGMFIRMYGLTGERLFADMARSAAIGRDSFVDSNTSVASYYWAAMNKGAGPYPHHAWWQVGWITDYLMAEAELRSAGKVSFPRGFVAPKVGPHQTYGFQPGTIYGNKANLTIREGFLEGQTPAIDPVLAEDIQTGAAYIILLNNRSQPSIGKVTVNAENWSTGKKIKTLQRTTSGQSLNMNTQINYEMPGFGMEVFTVTFE